MKTYIILDECTVIKNVTAQRTQRMLYAFNDVTKHGKSILKSVPKSVARAVLTGTPVTNGPMDLWAIFEFCSPNFFGRNWYAFQHHYGMYTSMGVEDAHGNFREIKVPLNEEHWHAIKGCLEFSQAAALFGCSQDTFNTVHSQDKYEGPYKHAEELKTKLSTVSRFALLRECVDMPAQNYVTHTLQMSTEQQSCYDSMVDEYIAQYKDHTATALSKMTAIIRLQQISSGFICDKNYNGDDTIASLFGLVDDTDITPDEIEWIGRSNPKLDMLYRDIDETAKPCIVITHFSAEAARIYSDLKNKYSVCLMTGWKRIGTIDDFKEGKYDVMVANSSVVSHGFNLQNSTTIIFYSNTFSLETRLQTEGRIFRLGQTQPCMYIDYAYEDSIDEKIVASLRMKRNLLDYIRDADMKEIVSNG
jgi:hypothetical protein